MECVAKDTGRAAVVDIAPKAIVNTPKSIAKGIVGRISTFTGKATIEKMPI